MDEESSGALAATGGSTPPSNDFDRASKRPRVDTPARSEATSNVSCACGLCGGKLCFKIGLDTPGSDSAKCVICGLPFLLRCLQLPASISGKKNDKSRLLLCPAIGIICKDCRESRKAFPPGLRTRPPVPAPPSAAAPPGQPEDLSVQVASLASEVARLSKLFTDFAAPAPAPQAGRPPPNNTYNHCLNTRNHLVGHSS